MRTEQRDYRHILQEEFEKRMQHNMAYSLRAYARDIGLAPSRLSEVLNRKSGLSRNYAKQIAQRLGFDPKTKDYFCDLVEAQHGRGRINRKIASLRARQAEFQSQYQDVTMDRFKVISEWYYFAILELTTLKDFKNDVAWMAKNLGISKNQVKLAIERLKNVGLLEEKNKTLVVTKEFTSGPDGISSDAVKNFNKGILEKAIAALYSQSIDERDVSSIIMAADAAHIDEVRKKIKKFRREINQFCNQAKTKNRVYCLSLQYFKLTHD